MKLTIAFAAVLAVATAADFSRGVLRPTQSAPRPAVNRVASSDQTASVLRYDNDASPDGSFSYTLEIDNGIAAQAQGVPRDFGGNPPIVPVVSQGSYSWISPEGEQIGITYTADENGFRPSGNAIPTSPPIPEPIARALAYLAQIKK